MISGGKDSIYAALECVKFGHQLTCLGNLYPVVEECKDSDVVNNEIDSYMFQTVGAEAIPLMAEWMGKPLIRKPITGKSVNQELYYELSEYQDEVEDLYLLLKDAKESYGIEAVSWWAILSDYQRLRVENVWDKLNLFFYLIFGK